MRTEKKVSEVGNRSQEIGKKNEKQHKTLVTG